MSNNEDDPWASLFLNAAGEAPPSSTIEKKLSKKELLKCNEAINNFIKKTTDERNKTQTFNQHVINKFRNSFNPKKKRTNKIVKINDVLPNNIAVGALQSIKNASDKQWQLAIPKTDKGSGGSNKYKDGAGSTAHRYEVGDGQVVNKSPFAWRSSKEDHTNTMVPLVIEALCNCMKNLLPSNRIGIFQAAKYTRGCFIEPHDDIAFKDIVDDQGISRRYERDIAVIYYLTKDWHYELGGNFVDLTVGGETHTPQFNSLVAFNVPRLHEVDLMKTDRHRITIFGWFYKLVNTTTKTTRNNMINNISNVNSNMKTKKRRINDDNIKNRKKKKKRKYKKKKKEKKNNE